MISTIRVRKMDAETSEAKNRQSKALQNANTLINEKTNKTVFRTRATTMLFTFIS